MEVQVKRDEFLLGVCVYLLIILAGHLGPDLSKIPFLDQKLRGFSRTPVQAAEEKLVTPVAIKEIPGNSLSMIGPKNPKRSGGYLSVRSSKYHSILKPKGNGAPANVSHQAKGPISPISFSL
jgi:hypothetical protein